jgi:16S rRNA (adenine1518-N6/adenine1519-N6)-dimethyltransferase
MNRPKKSLGQNFLIDKNVVQKILKLANIKKNNVIEIGPGTGNLTEEIIKENPESLLLVEKDNKLSELLKERFFKNNKVSLFNEDILSFKLENKIKNGSIIIGNLPYNISSQILIKLIKLNKWPPNYTKLVLMFQKEVAEKILACEKTSLFGRITIISNWRLKIKDHFHVSRNCFFPKPNVDSTVLVFEPIINKKYRIKDLENLEKITRIFFSSKRKMINKAFAKLFNNYEFYAKKLNLNLSKRPNEINGEDFYKITECFEKFGKKD